MLLVLGPSAGLALSEASFLGGIRSFCMSRSRGGQIVNLFNTTGYSESLPLASSKEVILWLGEKPWRAPMRDVFPPDRAPSGRAPVGVNPFNCRTCSDSSLEIKKVKVTNSQLLVQWRRGQEIHSYKTRHSRHDIIIQTLLW